MSARFLTPAAKQSTLIDYSATLVNSPHTGPDCPGGRGGVDPGMIPWNEMFNALPGVVTLQSCAGHAPTDSDGWYDACLWLWLSESSAAATYKSAPLLAALPHMRRTSVLWQSDGQEVWDLCFAGPAQKPCLSETLTPVLEHLRQWRHEDGAA